MLVAPSIHSCTGNLAAIVDRESGLQIQSGGRWNQRIQVEDRAIFPQESTELLTTIGYRAAHDLTLNVDRGRIAALIGAYSSEISDLSNIFPQNCVGQDFPRKGCKAHNLRVIIAQCLR
jgi:hypothetical protein